MLKELLMLLWGSHWEVMEIMGGMILEKANARCLFKKGKKDFPGLFHRLFSFTSNGHRLPEHPYIHVGALWPRWLDYFMAGKMSEGSSHQDHQGPCEKRLRELEKGHVEGQLTAACCYLQGGCQWYQRDIWYLLFAVVQGRTTADSWPRLKHKRFRLEIRKNFFFPSAWGWYKEVVQCLSLEVFKTQKLLL